MFHLVCQLRLLMVSDVFLRLLGDVPLLNSQWSGCSVKEKNANGLEGVTSSVALKFKSFESNSYGPSLSTLPQLPTLVRLKTARSHVHISASSTTTRPFPVLVPTWWSSDLTGAPATVRFNPMIGKKKDNVFLAQNTVLSTLRCVSV